MIIYRGVNVADDDLSGGKIIAKGDTYEMGVEFGCDDGHEAQFGTIGLQSGLSVANTAYNHNDCSDTFKSCLVSFTTCSTTAWKFATCNGFLSGWIYEVDTDYLDRLGIEYLPQAEDAINQEFEVAVSLRDLGHLPAEAIVGKMAVSPR